MRNKRLIIALLAAVTFGLIAALSVKQYLLSAREHQCHSHLPNIRVAAESDWSKTWVPDCAGFDRFEWLLSNPRQPSDFELYLNRQVGKTANKG
jgi:hypothetical protein